MRISATRTPSRKTIKSAKQELSAVGAEETVKLYNVDQGTRCVVAYLIFGTTDSHNAGAEDHQVGYQPPGYFQMVSQDAPGHGIQKRIRFERKPSTVRQFSAGNSCPKLSRPTSGSDHGTDYIDLVHGFGTVGIARLPVSPGTHFESYRALRFPAIAQDGKSDSVQMIPPPLLGKVGVSQCAFHGGEPHFLSTSNHRH